MLDPHLKESLDRASGSLIQSGIIANLVRLGEYYSLFRSRFGPEVIGGLQGEQSAPDYNNPYEAVQAALQSKWTIPDLGGVVLDEQGFDSPRLQTVDCKHFKRQEIAGLKLGDGDCREIRSHGLTR